MPQLYNPNQADSIVNLTQAQLDAKMNANPATQSYGQILGNSGYVPYPGTGSGAGGATGGGAGSSQPIYQRPAATPTVSSDGSISYPNGNPNGSAPGSIAQNIQNNLNTINTPNTPQSQADAESAMIASRRAQQQGQIDAINQQFATAINQENAAGKDRETAQNAALAAAGIMGGTTAASSIGKTKEHTQGNVDVLHAQQATAVQQALASIDNNAIAAADAMITANKGDALTALQVNQGIQQSSQKSLTTFAATSPVQWDAFAQQDPATAKKLMDQTGWDSTQAALAWNAAKTAAQQVQWSTPQQTKDGLLFYGNDPMTGQVKTMTLPGVSLSSNDSYQITNNGSLLRYSPTGIEQYLGNGTWGNPSGNNFGAAAAGLKLVKNADGSQSLVDAYTGTTITGAPPASSTTTSANGSISFRTNNPGNIKFGAYAQSLGATDSGIQASDGGTFAQFPSVQAGTDAQKQLLTNPTYQNLTFDDAMKQWSNKGYGAEIAPSIPPGTKMSSLTSSQLDAVVAAQKNREGWTAPPNAAGTLGTPRIDKSLPGYTTSVVPNTGGLTQAQIDQAALASALGQPMPGFSRGGSTGESNQRIKAIGNRSAEINIGGNIVANKAQLGALSSSLDDRVLYKSKLEQSLGNAENGFKQLTTSFSNSGINTNDSTLTNLLVNEIKKRITGGNLFAFNAGLQEVSTEYAQVFSRGSGVVPVSAQAKANDILDGNISLKDLLDVQQELQAQGKINLQGAIAEVSNIQDQINGIISPSSGSSSSSGNTGAGGGAASDPLGIL